MVIRGCCYRCQAGISLFQAPGFCLQQEQPCPAHLSAEVRTWLVQATQLLPGIPPWLGALRCTKASPAAGEISASPLCHTQTPETLSLLDVLVPQQNPASSPDTLFLAVLQLRLQQRRTREQLADQGIMPREYLFLLFRPLLAQRGCVHLGHCWGTV